MTLGASIVDRWWWQLSLTTAQVVATIAGVYLAAAIAIRHERAFRRAEASARAADALRPTVSRIARALEGVLTLEAEEAIHGMDDDRPSRKPPRLRLREELQRVQNDYRLVASSHIHHLGRLDLALALQHSLSVADAVDTILSALPSRAALADILGSEISSLRDYVNTVDHAFLKAALGQSYALPEWSPHFETQLNTLYETWFD